jgi:hypothetical protein
MNASTAKTTSQTPVGGYIVWVEGIARIPGWDTEGRAQLELVKKYAKILGLHVSTHEATEDGMQTRHKRRLTTRRVPFEDVAALALEFPGIRVDDVIERLYRTDPWTEAAKFQATGKLRVAVSRLGPSRVRFRIDRDGVERLYPPGAANAIAVLPPPPFLPSALSVPAIAAAAGRYAHHLLRFIKDGKSVEEVLYNDPAYFNDVARAIVTAARDADVPLPKEPT